MLIITKHNEKITHAINIENVDMFDVHKVLEDDSNQKINGCYQIGVLFSGGGEWAIGTYKTEDGAENAFRKMLDAYANGYEVFFAESDFDSEE